MHKCPEGGQAAQAPQPVCHLINSTMGNHISTDAVAFEDLIAYKPPSGPPPPLKYRSNLKVWRFFATDAPLQVKSAPVEPGFSGFDPSECYIALHIYKRQDVPASGTGGTAAAARGSSSGGTSSYAAASAPSSSKRVSELAQSGEQCLSPRGLSAPFSGYDDCGPYPFEQGSGTGGGDGEPLAHDIYVWNGRSSLALTKAVALTKCFELERTLINDEHGAIRHIHRGMGRPLHSLQSLFAPDYAPDAAQAENHLLATLCKHTDSEAIECSSLLACMLPGLSSLSSSAFPDLHRALASHAKPASPSLTSPAQSSHSPSTSPALGSASSASAVASATAGASSGPGGGIPRLSSLSGLTAGAAGGSDSLGAPPPAAPPVQPAAPPTAPPAAPPSAPVAVAAPSLSALPPLGRPQRPGSAGTNGPRMPPLGGLSSLSMPQTARESSVTPPSDAAPPAMPKLSNLGKGGLGRIGMGLDLSRVQQVIDNGDMEPNELTNKAEKLRYYNIRCSKVSDVLYVGSDTVARNKQLLLENGVTHVLNAAGVACHNYHEADGTFVYKTLHLFDSPREDISPMLYAAVEFIDAAIENGGRVYVHCHQGVSRSSSMAIAYLMWKEGINFDEGFTRVKTARGVCNPNAGFICRLLAFGKDIAATKPPSPPRLYRLSPFVGGPVARLVDGDDAGSKAVGGVGAAVLDPRTTYVLHGERGLILWVGGRSHPEYTDGARAWARLLQRFEHAAAPSECAQGSEPAAFWEMLGGEGEVPPRLPAYDKDYGVGTTPTIPPPEVEVQMPVISAPLSISGSGCGEGGSGGGMTIPGIHTTMSADDELPPPSARGRPTARSLPDGSETPRGAPPPVSERLAGLGLGGAGLGLGGGLKLAAPSAAPAEEPPPMTHRGEPPPRSFADLPRGGDELLPTPRGRRGGAEPEPEEPPRSSKKPREEKAGVDMGAAIAQRFAPEDGGYATVFIYPEWEEVPMFTRADFEAGCGFAVVLSDADGVAGKLVMWVGDESALSEERDSDILALGSEAAQELELPSGLPVELLFEADAEDDDPLYSYFSHGGDE